MPDQREIPTFPAWRCHADRCLRVLLRRCQHDGRCRVGSAGDEGGQGNGHAPAADLGVAVEARAQCGSVAGTDRCDGWWLTRAAAVQSRQYWYSRKLWGDIADSGDPFTGVEGDTLRRSG